jgi:soluble lytic murein transglycosylase-like protein
MPRTMRIFLILILCLFCWLMPQSGRCDLKTSIRKYQHTSIPAANLIKIVQYDYLIDYYSSFSFFQPGYTINPDFIRALILAESACDPYAVSSRKAFGLGQILFPTGREAARELAGLPIPLRYVDRKRLNDIRETDLFDPAINILLTCYLISKYNSRYDGKLELVLSAWNAGEGAGSLSLGMPAPYLETEELIGKVNGYYRYLLAQNRRFGRRYSFQ